LRAVVEDKVDSGELLQGLKTHACPLPLGDRTAETVQVARLAYALFVVVVCFDLTQLFSNGGMVWSESPQLRQGLGGLFDLISHDEVARGFREDQHPANQDDGEGKLDGNGDSV
jgi:hypothetical protein